MAFRKLCELVRSDDHAVALRASAEVLDRAVGRAVQSVELLGILAHVDLGALSDADLRQHVIRLQERLAANGPAPSDAP